MYPTPAAEIFKAYDIRGIVDKTLTEQARSIGHALGAEARAHNQVAIAVGRDGRLSGPRLARALVVLVGQKKALAMAVKGKQVQRRWSKLNERLAAADKSSSPID